MDIAAYSTAVKLVEAQNEASVKVVKGALEQSEVIANILLSGISEVVDSLPEGKGENLNVTV